MFVGRPPPLNPYGKWQPDAASSSTALMIDMPDRCIECSDIGNTSDVQFEGSTRGLLPVFDAVIQTAIDPLDDSSTFDMFQANEGISSECQSPLHGTAEVCTKQL